MKRAGWRLRATGEGHEHRGRVDDASDENEEESEDIPRANTRYAGDQQRHDSRDVEHLAGCHPSPRP